MLRRLVPEDPKGITIAIRDASETRPASSPSATLFSLCYASSPLLYEEKERSGG
jgi:hypothetical protein